MGEKPSLRITNNQNYEQYIGGLPSNQNYRKQFNPNMDCSENPRGSEDGEEQCFGQAYSQANN